MRGRGDPASALDAVKNNGGDFGQANPPSYAGFVQLSAGRTREPTRNARTTLSRQALVALAAVQMRAV